MPMDNRLKKLFDHIAATYPDFGGIDITDVHQTGMGENRLLDPSVKRGHGGDTTLSISPVEARFELGLGWSR